MILSTSAFIETDLCFIFLGISLTFTHSVFLNVNSGVFLSFHNKSPSVNVPTYFPLLSISGIAVYP